MNKPVGKAVLLTSDDVRRWQDELREHEEKAAALKKKLEAAAVLSGIEGDEAGGEESMSEAVTRYLGTIPRPFFHHEVQAELRKIPRFRETLERNQGGYYYTVIGRLTKRGLVKKSGKKRIRLVQKNETPPEGNPESAS